MNEGRRGVGDKKVQGEGGRANLISTVADQHFPSSVTSPFLSPSTLLSICLPRLDPACRCTIGPHSLAPSGNPHGNLLTETSATDPTRVKLKGGLTLKLTHNIVSHVCVPFPLRREVQSPTHSHPGSLTHMNGAGQSLRDLCIPKQEVPLSPSPCFGMICVEQKRRTLKQQAIGLTFGGFSS